MLGIILGLCIGSVLYACIRIMTPPNFAMASATIGLSAGIGARLFRAFGTPSQMRLIIFGSLFGLVLVEHWLIELTDLGVSSGVDASRLNLVGHFLSSPLWLAFTIVFLVGGIVLGIRLVVGNDPMGDVLAHGATIANTSGSQCPRCESRQTILDSKSLELECTQCGHRWRDPGF